MPLTKEEFTRELFRDDPEAEPEDLPDDRYAEMALMDDICQRIAFALKNNDLIAVDEELRKINLWWNVGYEDNPDQPDIE